jgi:hypothetical protein
VSHGLRYHPDSRRRFADRLGQGAYAFTDLPAGEIEIEVRLDGWETATRHDTRDSGLEIVVPLSGALLVDWELPSNLVDTPDPNGMLLDLILIPEPSRVPHIKLLIIDVGEGSGSESFDHVPIGEYWAYLRRDDPDQTGVERGKIRKQIIGERAHVVVTRNGTTRLRVPR